jgi:hypothetical protein
MKKFIEAIILNDVQTVDAQSGGDGGWPLLVCCAAKSEMPSLGARFDRRPRG